MLPGGGGGGANFKQHCLTDWKYVGLGTLGAQAPWAMEGGRGQLLPSAAGAAWAN